VRTENPSQKAKSSIRGVDIFKLFSLSTYFSIDWGIFNSPLILCFKILNGYYFCIPVELKTRYSLNAVIYYICVYI